MPYVLVSVQVHLQDGPTVVGDESSDPELMARLGAKLERSKSMLFHQYTTPHCPRVVLNKLEEEGYTLAGQSGAGQTMVWTMYKPLGTGTSKQ